MKEMVNQGEFVIETNLKAVLVHEIGHILGLAHSSKKAAIMHETFNKDRTEHLDEDDIYGVEYIFGKVERNLKLVNTTRPFKSEKVDSFIKCMSTCKNDQAANTGCLIVSYQHSTRLCHHFSYENFTTTNHSDWTTIFNSSIANHVHNYEPHKKIRMLNEKLDSFNLTENENFCMEKCTLNSNCTSLSFNKKNKICYLFSQTNSIVSSCNDKTADWRTFIKSNEDHPDAARSLNHIGLTYDILGEYKKALSYKEKALAMRERIYKNNTTDHPDIARSLTSIAATYNALGMPKQALNYYEKALKVYERIHKNNTDHFQIAESLNHIGLTYSSLGEYRKALDYHERSLQMRERIQIDQIDIADSLDSIGSIYVSLGDYKKALDYKEKALTIQERVFNKTDQLAVATTLNNVGLTYDLLGDYHKALDYFERSLAMRERLSRNRTDHPTPLYEITVSYTLNNIGQTYDSMGEYKKSLQYFERSYKIQLKIYKNEYYPDISI
jgi:tetratricopeptide (TPR) repeat protein